MNKNCEIAIRRYELCDRDGNVMEEFFLRVYVKALHGRHDVPVKPWLRLKEAAAIWHGSPWTLLAHMPELIEMGIRRRGWSLLLHTERFMELVVHGHPPFMSRSEQKARRDAQRKNGEPLKRGRKPKDWTMAVNIPQMVIAGSR